MDNRIKVASILDDFTVVLNCGAEDGVEKNQKFTVFSLGNEIFDPDTKESLGFIEIVKGTGVVTHVQPHMCTIVSDTFKTLPPIITHSNFGVTRSETIERRDPERLPFKNAEISDFAKRIE